MQGMTMKIRVIILALGLAGCGLALHLLPTGAGEQKKEGKVTTTNSGLKFIDLEPGNGEAAKAGDTVDVHYTGFLKDGRKFDSSVDRGTPFSFKLGAGAVIKGWDE